jgi:cysteine synthase A
MRPASSGPAALAGRRNSEVLAFRSTVLAHRSLFEFVRNGELKATGKGSVTEGIGIGRVTENFKGAPVDAAEHVEDPETVRTVYRLLQEEGLFLGSTSGINVAAAVRVARELGPGHTVVTILCDGGAKYVSRLFDRGWLEEKGLLAAAREGELIAGARVETPVL